ncbi:MAG: right-handed parallel beta-helix repeat-containing protein [Pseudomonadota bacterium]|nr:right-handed parallel beta-helix repeat-containing protein [Pseudomonadota bacterium]
MSGDHTRFTYNPKKRFAAVQMQQGRVQLDADWNEQADLQRERTRLLSLDSGGPAWLPELTTPDAFLIGLAGGGDLSIQPGRIYVEGRLAEIFPDEGITYLKQPFLPMLPQPPAFNNAIDTIVYLDLWEREVTWAEDLALLDVALGGVDTTTRVQQVWQVKIREQRGVSATCGVDLDALFPPSSGRLTTSAVAPPAPDDPCILPPKSGYRGIENRCYRVEIQKAGPLGTALFKWSRDNGSIVSRVKDIAVAGTSSFASVDRLDRDEVLKLRIDDWVTVTDDHRDLYNESGEMARIVDIDEAARVVMLDHAIPASGRPFGATPAEIVERNTRIQRWDQNAPLNALDADGLMTTGAGPIDLEDGVQVSFSTATPGGSFNVGDYWVFAARTADASVEKLNQAPPRGIRHQYLQLAAIPAGGQPVDCRPKPRSKGCCTIVVPPGTNLIQDAVDKLPKEGGCVCLKVGQHLIDRPILIKNPNVTLHGESLGANVFNRSGTGLLEVLGCNHVRVMTIWFQQGEAAQQPVLFVGKSEDVVIDDCRIESFGRGPESIGLRAALVSELTVSGCHFARPVMGIKLENSGEIRITDCDFLLADPASHIPTNVAILADRMSGPLIAEGNSIASAINGIVVRDMNNDVPVSRALYSRISCNRIFLAESRTQSPAYGIDVAADSSLILANQIRHEGGVVTGIRTCGNGSTVSENFIESHVELVGRSVAISAGFRQGILFKALERVVITDNVVDGSQQGVVLSEVARVIAEGNLLGRNSMKFGVGFLLSNCQDCRIAGNMIVAPVAGILARDGERNRIEDNQIEGGLRGIDARGEESPVFNGNIIRGTERSAINVRAITGRCELSGNKIFRCGSGANLGMSIEAFGIYGEWHVESNEIYDTGLSMAPNPPVPSMAVGIFGYVVREARIESNTISYGNPLDRKVTDEDRALLLLGEKEYVLNFGGFAMVEGYPVQISNNKFTGVGSKALVELLEVPIGAIGFMRFERVIFTGNYFRHWNGMPNTPAASVWLTGRHCTVSGNQVKATTRLFPSYYLGQMSGPFLGNFSTGGVLDRPPTGGFPTPQSDFNFTA